MTGAPVQPIHLSFGTTTNLKVEDAAATFRLETTRGTVLSFRAAAGTTVSITAQDDVAAFSITIDGADTPDGA